MYCCVRNNSTWLCGPPLLGPPLIRSAWTFESHVTRAHGHWTTRTFAFSDARETETAPGAHPTADYNAGSEGTNTARNDENDHPVCTRARQETVVVSGAFSGRKLKSVARTRTPAFKRPRHSALLRSKEPHGKQSIWRRRRRRFFSSRAPPGHRPPRARARARERERNDTDRVYAAAG